MKSELESFDGRDNRREIMILLGKLGSDHNRARFLESLIPSSLKGFKACPIKVTGKCDVGIAYFMLVSVCNELGVSINHAAQKLDRRIKMGILDKEVMRLDIQARMKKNTLQ